MMTRTLSIFMVIALISSLLIAPLSAAAQTTTQPAADTAKSTAFPVTGTGSAASGAVTFDGTFTVQRFRVENGKLMAVGRMLGTVTETVGGKTTKMDDQDVSLPVESINGKAIPTAGDGGDNQNQNNDGETGWNGETAAMLEMAQAAPSCNILNLILGPLRLNLLGLVVDLNQVLLNVTGQTGAGNLLGNLLCAIAGLLDRAGTLSVLTNLLNALLDIRRLGLA